MRPFPWLGWRDRARVRAITDADVREALAQEPAWLDGEHVEEAIVPETPKKSVTSCVVCGKLEDAVPTPQGGVSLTLIWCQDHTQQLAGESARKVSRRFWREQLEAP